MDKYQEENNILLEGLLDNFYRFWKTDESINSRNVFNSYFAQLEFFVTPVCNQACTYCYLIKHGDQLFPKEIRDTEQILNNLKIYMQFLLDNNLNPPRLDLFSGEIWGMKLGADVLKIILDYVKKGVKIKGIMIPSNFSFITDPTATALMQYFLTQFNRYGCRMVFSASIDGEMLDKKMRPFIGNGNTEQYKNDDYYKKIFEFCFQNNLGFHPMVSAASIDYWPENYVWWHEQLEKYHLSTDAQSWFGRTMFLEVRNDEWTDDTILKYIKFLKFAIDYDFNKYFKNNPTEFYHFILDTKNKYFDLQTNTYKHAADDGDYICYGLHSGGNIPGCSVARALTVRLGDLSILPCHRTAYPKFLYGKYNVDNNKIVGVTANNPLLANRIYNQTFKGSFKCDTCPNIYCGKGCYGAQYESTGELFYPCPSVCELETAKSIFLLLNKFKFVEDYPEIKKQSSVVLTNDMKQLAKIIEMPEGKKWVEIIKKNLF